MDDAFHKISICPLQHGFTVPDPDRRVTLDMCAPVFPETEHPTSREPLKTNKPLPWTGCYHPTCMSIYVWLPEAWLDYASAYKLETPDRCQMMLLADQDWRTREGIVTEEREPTAEEMERSAALEREWREHDDLASLMENFEGYEGDECASGRVPFPCPAMSDASGFESDWSHPGMDEDVDFDQCKSESDDDGHESTANDAVESPDEGGPNDYGDGHPKVVIPVVRFTPKLGRIEKFHSPTELQQDILQLQR